MRTVHRWVMIVAAVFMLFLAATGLLIQGVDLLSMAHPDSPQNAPNIKSIKEFAAGPPYFSVLSSVDEGGAMVNQSRQLSWFQTAFLVAEHAQSKPVTSIELIMQAAGPLALVTVGRDDAHAQLLTVDPEHGALLSQRPAAGSAASQSTHDAIKDWHRGNIIGISGVWLNLGSGLALLVLCITGVGLYWQLWTRRRRSGRNALFWS